MRHIDDSELSRRLAALRTDPPPNDFEARLDARLRSAANEPPTALPSTAARGRVIVGPWLRRRPVRIVAVAALFMAGAAAALEGGVIEWVQSRVSSPPEAPPPLAAPAPRVTRPEPVQQRSLAEPAAAPEPALTSELTAPAPVEPSPLRQAPVPRVALENREPKGPSLARHANRAPLAERLAVPRVKIDIPNAERLERVEGRIDRSKSPAGAALSPLERRPAGLERAREVARPRRDRAAAERGRSVERARERRERLRYEHREAPAERTRGERPGR